ncbi:hypothetical protein BGZ68_002455 [Mortierella alpina]|nr:hypothetical protein BGZ68_002455 [Mortierella alpina]
MSTMFHMAYPPPSRRLGSASKLKRPETYPIKRQRLDIKPMPRTARRQPNRDPEAARAWRRKKNRLLSRRELRRTLREHTRCFLEAKHLEMQRWLEASKAEEGLVAQLKREELETDKLLQMEEPIQEAGRRLPREDRAREAARAEAAKAQAKDDTMPPRPW